MALPWSPLSKAAQGIDALSKRCSLCAQKGIPANRKSFPLISSEEFAQAKRSSIRLYAYANRIVAILSKYLTDSKAVFALFNQDACLLKLYGQPDTLTELSQKGLCRMSDWQENSIGANAVSVGLTYNLPVAACGGDNYSSLLADYAVYFAPCALENDSGTSAPYVFGGIALILPQEKSHPDYLMTTVAAAEDIVLHIFMADSLHKAYYSDENGMITVDINVQNGKTSIIYHDQNIFKVFAIPCMDLYFKKVDTLFDLPPANQRFWSILDNRERVSCLNIDLTVQGHTDLYQITTEPYQQNGLSLAGMRFYVTSPRNLSSKISKNIGNNAVMTFSDIIRQSAVMQNVVRQAKAIADSDSNVLIMGESGTGKDIFAQAIHNASQRCRNPFLVINCAAFPRDFLAGRLFGYQDGAFSQAPGKSNIGSFELANTGTLYLDDIDELPLELQSTLLDAIEQRYFRRVGSQTQIISDVRIIASTKANLVQLIGEKKFRADLYYRLSTLHLNLPPLRERGQDSTLLAEEFVKKAAMRLKRNAPIVLPCDSKKLIKQLNWDGNVRELQNVMESIVQLNPTLDVIDPAYIIENLSSAGTLPRDYDSYGRFIPPSSRNLTKDIVEDALKACHYNKSLAAQRLNISRRTLYRYLERLHLNDSE